MSDTIGCDRLPPMTVRSALWIALPTIRPVPRGVPCPRRTLTTCRPTVAYAGNRLPLARRAIGTPRVTSIRNAMTAGSGRRRGRKRPLDTRSLIGEDDP